MSIVAHTSLDATGGARRAHGSILIGEPTAGGGRASERATARDDGGCRKCRVATEARPGKAVIRRTGPQRRKFGATTATGRSTARTATATCRSTARTTTTTCRSAASTT